MIAHEIPFLDYVPKIYISAVTHQRLNNIYTKVEEVYNELLEEEMIMSKFLSKQHAQYWTR